MRAALAWVSLGLLVIQPQTASSELIRNSVVPEPERLEAFFVRLAAGYQTPWAPPPRYIALPSPPADEPDLLARWAGSFLRRRGNQKFPAAPAIYIDLRQLIIHLFWSKNHYEVVVLGKPNNASRPYIRLSAPGSELSEELQSQLKGLPFDWESLAPQTRKVIRGVADVLGGGQGEHLPPTGTWHDLDVSSLAFPPGSAIRELFHLMVAGAGSAGDGATQVTHESEVHHGASGRSPKATENLVRLDTHMRRHLGSQGLRRRGSDTGVVVSIADWRNRPQGRDK